jgi:hypothetical protein
LATAESTVPKDMASTAESSEDTVLTASSDPEAPPLASTSVQGQTASVVGSAALVAT